MKVRVISFAALPFALAADQRPLLAAIGPVFAAIPEKTSCMEGLGQAIAGGVQRVATPAITVEDFCSGEKGETEIINGLAADISTALPGEAMLPYVECVNATFEKLFIGIFANRSNICPETTPAPHSAASPFAYGVATTLALIAVFHMA